MTDFIPSRTISKIITDLEHGDFSVQLTNAVQDLMAEMEEIRQEYRGKPSGAITIKLKFKNEDGVIEVKSEFSVTQPARPRPKTIYWLTHDHHLTLNNPRQQEMSFRDVNAGPGKAAAIDA